MDTSNSTIRLAAILIGFDVLCCGAAGLTDDQISNAIRFGASHKSRDIWRAIRKEKRVRINRAGFKDSVQKYATFIDDWDRVALLASESTRKLQALGVEDVRSKVPLDRLEVLVESEATGMYAMNLSKWVNLETAVAGAA